MKQVRIVNVKTGVPVSVNSDAETFGELVGELRDTTPFQDIDFSKCHCFIRDEDGRRSIGLVDEPTSEYDRYTLYISPAEMKGGLDEYEQENLAEALRYARAAINTALEELGEETGLNDEEEDDLEAIRRGL